MAPNTLAYCLEVKSIMAQPSEAVFLVMCDPFYEQAVSNLDP